MLQLAISFICFYTIVIDVPSSSIVKYSFCVGTINLPLNNATISFNGASKSLKSQTYPVLESIPEAKDIISALKKIMRTFYKETDSIIMPMKIFSLFCMTNEMCSAKCEGFVFCENAKRVVH
jgi:hypothetical protein